ncbi:hypothetical protein HIM_00212 [Hirsutella minnesotensis 3608]|nr:hypothetical protein HIM_00212 [Hirsutella minnesotensis 3608]
MASPPSQPLSGTDGIRSLQDQDSIFRAFDAYPWSKDKTFLSGLSAILGEPNSQGQRGSLVDIATHARIFYYSQRIGVQIDFARYQAWLARNPGHQPPQLVASDAQRDPSSNPVLPWQQAAPKAELFVHRSATPAPQDGTTGEPNYPMAFAEMLKLLQEGKPVPGIRQIPNTVVRDPSVKPVGARTAPRKPWEKDAAPVASDMELPKALDTEFPPVDDDPFEVSNEETQPQG